DALGGGRAVRAAVDMACYDWLGKRAGLPVYGILGGDISRIAETSLTVGINPPEVARERALGLLEDGARQLKIKLGSPAGLEADMPRARDQSEADEVRRIPRGAAGDPRRARAPPQGDDGLHVRIVPRHRRKRPPLALRGLSRSGQPPQPSPGPVLWAGVDRWA